MSEKMPAVCILLRPLTFDFVAMVFFVVMGSELEYERVPVPRDVNKKLLAEL